LSLEEALRDEFHRERRRSAGDSCPEPAKAGGYVARGRYAEQLERWFQHFPRSQFLIVEFDDQANDSLGVYRRVLDFVGVDPDAAQAPEFQALNTGSRRDTDPDTIAIETSMANAFDPQATGLTMAGWTSFPR